MFLNVDPIVVTGQIYFHPSFDDYTIVTKADNGLVNFFGVRNGTDSHLPVDKRRHFYGKMDSSDFVLTYPASILEDVVAIPKDIADFLLAQCPPKTTLMVGFEVTDDMIIEDEDEDDEELSDE